MATELEAGIISADAAALARFYVDGLGFTTDSVRSFPQGELRRLRRDRARLKIYQPATGAEPHPRPEPWHRFDGFAYAALLVDDASAAVEQAEQHGARVLTPVTAHRPGAAYALVADPEDNVWELLEEVP